MKVQGLLEVLNVDGYERMLGIRSGEQLIYCTALQADEYLELGESSSVLVVGQPISVEVFLSVASVSSAQCSEECGLVQDIAESPHAIVTGDVLAITGEDSCVLGLNHQGDLLVEFELPVKPLPGQRVCVVGELMVVDAD